MLFARFAGLALLGALASCNISIYQYEIDDETWTDIDTVTGAATIQVEPLEISYQPDASLDVTPEKWTEHVRDFHAYFHERFAGWVRYHKAKQEIVMLEDVDTATGIVLHVDITDLRKDDPSWTAATVTIRDTESDAVLYSARMRANAYIGRSSPPFSFVGRIERSIDHYCHGVATVLRDGRLEKTPKPRT